MRCAQADGQTTGRAEMDWKQFPTARRINSTPVLPSVPRPTHPVLSAPHLITLTSGIAAGDRLTGADVGAAHLPTLTVADAFSPPAQNNLFPYAL